MTEIQKALWAMHEDSYGDFQARLIPGIPRSSIIGVRMPKIRQLAKELVRDNCTSAFLSELPHAYFDENILHGAILSLMKDFPACLSAVEAFLPYIDNWAACDLLSPKVFRKHREELLPYIRKWAASAEPYTCRFGLEMLMSFYLDDSFLPEYLEIPAKVRSEEYYVNMMIAWFFATALAKQWESAIPYITENRLPVWVHNKSIQKALESYRITPEQKGYLRCLKVK